MVSAGKLVYLWYWVESCVSDFWGKFDVSVCWCMVSIFVMSNGRLVHLWFSGGRLTYLCGVLWKGGMFFGRRFQY